MSVCALSHASIGIELNVYVEAFVSRYSLLLLSLYKITNHRIIFQSTRHTLINKQKITRKTIQQ